MTPTVDNNGSQERWLVDLRRQLLCITERRVDREAAEDLVQDAMSIIATKAPGLKPGALVGDEPGLAWCFQVLRNVIGNHYQSSGRRRHENLDAVDPADRKPDPLASFAQQQRRDRIDAALSRLGQEHPACRRYLQSMLDGESPADIAAGEGVAAAVLHRRLYRCRAWMRTILIEMGVEP